MCSLSLLWPHACMQACTLSLSSTNTCIFYGPAHAWKLFECMQRFILWQNTSSCCSFFVYFLVCYIPFSLQRRWRRHCNKERRDRLLPSLHLLQAPRLLRTGCQAAQASLSPLCLSNTKETPRKHRGGGESSHCCCHHHCAPQTSRDNNGVSCVSFMALLRVLPLVMLLVSPIPLSF